MRAQDDRRPVRSAAAVHVCGVVTGDDNRTVGQVVQTLTGYVGRIGNRDSRRIEVQPGPLHRRRAGHPQHEFKHIDPGFAQLKWSVGEMVR